MLREGRLDRWFHPSLTRDRDGHRQVRLLLAITLALVLGGSLIVAQKLWLGDIALARDFAGVVLLGLLTIGSLRWVSSTRFVANLVPTLVLVGVTIINLHTHGLGYPSLHALTLAPLVAFLLAGPRSGLIFGLLGVAEVLVLRAVHPDPSSVGTQPNWAQVQVTGSIALMITTCGLTWAYERLKNDTLQELRHQRERADHASAAKDVFLANVSHEIRTPMNGVLGMLELLHSRLDGEDRQMAQVAQDAAQSLLRLLNDILDAAKLDANAVQLESAPVDVVQSVRTAAALFEDAARAKGLGFEVDLPANTQAVIMTDALRLQQILLNLLGNALKFTDKGQISISLQAEDRQGQVQLQIEVRDTGCGIEQDKLPDIFERFRQADDTTTRKFAGTGLGLSISRSLAQRLGGALEVSSELNKGSSFTLTVLGARAALPAAPQEAPRPRAAPSLDPLPITPSVLIVEDDAVNRMVCSRMLQQLGATYETAHNGQEALEALRTGQFTLVLMDCQMPVMDGFEATRCIRALPAPTGATPVIALTAQALAGDREACLQAGMDDYLTKPISRAALAAALKRWGQTPAPPA